MKKSIVTFSFAIVFMLPVVSFATTAQVIATNSPTTVFFNFSAPSGQYINKISGFWSSGIGYIIAYANGGSFDTIMISQDPNIYFSTATATSGNHIIKLGPDGASYFHAWSGSGSLGDIIYNFNSTYTWTFTTFIAPACEVITGFTSSSGSWDYLTAVSSQLIVIVSGGGTYCNSTTLTASGGLGGIIYWQGTTSGGTSTATASTSQTVTSSGIYYFREYNTCGWGPQGSATVIIDTTITIPTAVTVSGGGTFCNSATLIASGGTGGIIYWQDTTSGGTSAAIASSSQTVNSSGTYYFRANNNCGWGLQGSATVIIDTTVSIPTAVTVSGAGTFCNSATLIASGGTGGIIYWQDTTSGGTSTAIASSSQTVNSSGTYYFRANNNCGWSTDGSAVVTIDTIAPTAVTASTFQTSLCKGDTITLTGSAIGATSWSWSGPGGYSSILQNPATTAISTGIFTLTASNICGSSTAQTQSVIVHIVDTTVSQSGVTLTAIATGVTYQWINCNGNLAIVGQTNQIFNATANGSYAVEINNNGCVDTSSCYLVTSVGITENDFGLSLNIYPNPTSGKVTLGLGETYNDVDVTVKNTLGQTILTKNYSSTNKLNFEINEAPGVYIIEIHTHDGKSAILKVLKD